MNIESTTIGWRAPSNIALIKYWGKKAMQLPENGSLSMTLDQSGTTTYLTYSNKEPGDTHPVIQYFFHKERNLLFEAKIEKYLRSLRPELPWLSDFHLSFHSENNFPHSTGIASSASSMAALALCLVSLEEVVKGHYPDHQAFLQRASYLARLGSGSAARSLYGGLVTWGRIPELPGTSDLFATPLPLSATSRLNSLRDAILIVSEQEKSLSSSTGHAMMTTHPYREGRRQQVNLHLPSLLKAIGGNDYVQFGEITEMEALSLHALLMTSAPEGLLLLPNTLQLISEIKAFRKRNALDLYFTLDAGPNLHLLYFEEDQQRVKEWITDKLSGYCENGKWIDDKMGMGPKRVES